MSKYNSIEDVIKAKDALLNKLFAPAVTPDEGFTVMQQIRKDALMDFMTNDLSHGNLEFDVVQQLTRNLVLGVNGDKDKVIELLVEYVSEAIDLYNDFEADGLKNLPASTLDAIFTDELHPDLLEVFDMEMKMYEGKKGTFVDDFTPTSSFIDSAGIDRNVKSSKYPYVKDEDIVTLVQQIIKNEIHHSIRHVMPESFEMRTILVNHPQVHYSLGYSRDNGFIDADKLDELYTFKIYDFEVNGWDEFNTAILYLEGEFKNRANEFIFGTKNNNRFFTSHTDKMTKDKYFAYLGYGSWEQSFYHSFNKKLTLFLNEERNEIRDKYYEEMVSKKIEEAGFDNEAGMLDYAGGQDYGQYDGRDGPKTFEEVNAQYNEIVMEYNYLVEDEMYDKLGGLMDDELIAYGKYGVFDTRVDNATEIPINSKLPVFVSEIEPAPSIEDTAKLLDEADEAQKIFDAGDDLPINEEVLKQNVGGRQMGFGSDELDIIEGTAFKEIMDDIDAKGINYSDVDIYSYIPENERLTPYLIFKEGQRNRWFTDEFVDYLVKVSARGAYRTIGYNEQPFPPDAQIHEYALKNSYAKGPNAFGEMLFDTVLDRKNPRGGLSSSKVEIKYVNNIFPGGSFTAAREEANRRYYEDLGMTPEGEWLPEVQKQIDEGVAFDEIVKTFEQQDALDVDTPTNVVEPEVKITDLTEINLQITDPDGLHARPVAKINDYLTNNNITAYVMHKGKLIPYSFTRVLMKGLKYNQTLQIYFPKDVPKQDFVDNMILLGVGDEVDARGSSLRTGVDVESYHSQRIRDVATQYHTIMGFDEPQFKPAVVFSDELGATASDLFDQLPMFDEAALPYYKKFIQETNMQYQLLLDSGIQFEIVNYDPYTPNRSGHNQMITDMENGRLKVLATDTGFGDDTTDIRNPMLAESKYTDLNGRVMLENDVFRAVHDTFGHGMRGNTFGPIGEYNAWLAHKEMYSRDAQRVMTTETLGQNTFTNYGPHMRDAEGNLIAKGDPRYVGPADRPFAPQKVALVPEELIDAAGTVVEDVAELVDNEAMNKVTQLVNTNPQVANTLWNQSKKIVGKAFNTVTGVLDPGDVIITQGLLRILPRLGLAAISGPALAAYIFYELAVLGYDAGQALNKAREKQGLGTVAESGGAIFAGLPPFGDGDWKQLGKDTWNEFGDISDTWSLSWKISEPIIKKAFESYGKLDNRLYTSAMENR